MASFDIPPTTSQSETFEDSLLFPGRFTVSFSGSGLGYLLNLLRSSVRLEAHFLPCIEFAHIDEHCRRARRRLNQPCVKHCNYNANLGDLKDLPEIEGRLKMKGKSLNPLRQLQSQVKNPFQPWFPGGIGANSGQQEIKSFWWT